MHNHHQLVLPLTGKLSLSIESVDGDVEHNKAAIIPSGSGHAYSALFCHLLLEETVWPAGWVQWVGVVGLGPVGIAFFTWDRGVKHGNIQLLGTMAYSAPLISVILLIMAGYGTASLAVLGASILIVTGSLVASRVRKRSALQSEAI